MAAEIPKRMAAMMMRMVVLDIEFNSFPRWSTKQIGATDWTRIAEQEHRSVAMLGIWRDFWIQESRSGRPAKRGRFPQSGMGFCISFCGSFGLVVSIEMCRTT
jgi:hypothetical protein